jgi:hypothetical protein
LNRNPLDPFSRGSNNFSFPMTIEGNEGDRLLPGVNNNHHKHLEKSKKQVDGERHRNSHCLTSADMPERYQNGLARVLTEDPE